MTPTAVTRRQLLGYRSLVHDLGTAGDGSSVLDVGLQDCPPGRSAWLALQLRTWEPGATPSGDRRLEPTSGIWGHRADPRRAERHTPAPDQRPGAVRRRAPPHRRRRPGQAVLRPARRRARGGRHRLRRCPRRGRRRHGGSDVRWRAAHQGRAQRCGEPCGEPCGEHPTGTLVRRLSGVPCARRAVPLRNAASRPADRGRVAEPVPVRVVRAGHAAPRPGAEPGGTRPAFPARLRTCQARPSRRVAGPEHGRGATLVGPGRAELLPVLVGDSTLHVHTEDIDLLTSPLDPSRDVCCLRTTR